MSYAYFSIEDVIDHDDPEGEGFWVIADSYVLDLSAFLRHHPSGARKIIQRRKKAIDISSNFLDHFPHTVRTFRDACRQYDRTGEKVTFRFEEVAQEVQVIGKVKA
jgi:cytochrome b involved in lipid metabolism